MPSERIATDPESMPITAFATPIRRLVRIEIAELRFMIYSRFSLSISIKGELSI